MPDGIVKRIAIVSFNENERAAVNQLLDDIAPGASPWGRDGELAISRRRGDELWRLEHVPLRAQGNVIAGAQVVSSFAARRQSPDYVVFYGCAGAVLEDHVGRAFLVQHAHYLSLGTVAEKRGREVVTLKNKWLCDLDPADLEAVPLQPVTFPMAIPGRTAVDLPRLIAIDGAEVLATDKVIKIPAGTPPTPAVPGPRPRYLKDEWSYGTALGLWASSPTPVLVEMESYGIGRMADALNLGERVVVLRVATDDLKSHATSEAGQRHLLREGRVLLGRILAILFDPSQF